MPQLSSPLPDDEKRLRDEARFLIAQLRWPGVSDDESVARTLRNYPELTEDDVRSWWREKAFRDQVREAREIAEQYAQEGDFSPFLPQSGRDVNEIPAERAFGTHPSFLGWP